MQSINARDIKTLKRRRDHLLKRVGMSDKNLTFDIQEAKTLEKVIKYLEEKELDKYRITNEDIQN